MIELTEPHFRALCEAVDVRRLIDEADGRDRRAAMGVVATLLLGLAVVGAGVAATLAADQRIAAAAIGSFGGLAVCFATANALGGLGRSPGLPIFDRLAWQAHLSYEARAEEPPAYREAKPHLFDMRTTVERFTHLFQGTDGGGQYFATWRARLAAGSRSRARPVFDGRIFAFARLRPGEGRVMIVPAGRFFSRTRQPGDMQKLVLGVDPAFERAFQVHASTAEEGRAMLRREVRALLLELREQGPVTAYAGPDAVLVATASRAGVRRGFRFRRGEAKVRAAFDEVAGSLQLLGRLKRAFDPYFQDGIHGFAREGQAGE